LEIAGVGTPLWVIGKNCFSKSGSPKQTAPCDINMPLLDFEWLTAFEFTINGLHFLKAMAFCKKNLKRTK
jgi:hypothetical protein